MWLNEWAEPEDRLVHSEDLAAITRTDPEPLPHNPTNGRYLITVDLGLTQDRTAVTVSHREAEVEGRPIVIDQIRTWEGTRRRPVNLGEVESHIAFLSAEYGRAWVLIDPYQAAQLTEGLKTRGIKIHTHQFTQGSNSQLAQALYQAIRDRTLRLPDHPGLAEELLHLQLSETSPGVWRIDHHRGRHDDQAITVAMACWWHTTRNHQRPLLAVGPLGDRKESNIGRFDHPDLRHF